LGRRQVVVTTALVLTAVSLPVQSIDVHAGLDPSWVAAMSLAHVQGVRFGHDLAFTYGPLGFLAVPSEIYLRGAVLGFVYAAVTAALLYSALCAAASRWLPMPAAIAIVAAFSIPAATLNTPELGEMALVALTVPLVVPSKLETPLAPWIPATLGTLAALQLCVKFNTGIFFLLVTAVVTLARPGRVRAVAIATASFVAALPLLWVLAGQSLGELLPWIHVSSVIASGYSDAMALRPPGALRWFEWFMLAVPIAFFTIWAVTRLRREWRTCLPLVTLVAVCVWLFTKHGFVRDYGFRDITFVAFASMILTMEWSGWPRRVALPLAGLCLCTVLLTVEPWPDKVTEIVDRHREAPAAVWELARRVTDSGPERAAIVERHKSAVLSTYGLDDATLGLVRGTVQIDPWDASIAWAGNLRWGPVPVFQIYAAYGKELDHMNADALRDNDRPETILRTNLSIDGRLATWESPEYQVAMTCNYDHAATTGPWEVLYARSHDRCGQPVLLNEQTLAPGEEAHVPRPHASSSLVVVTLDYPVSSLRAIITAALRPLRLSGVGVDGEEHRFIGASAGEPHLVSVPSDATLPNAGLDIRSFDFPNPDGRVTAHFYEIPTD
jgi:hypothetical protein